MNADKPPSDGAEIPLNDVEAIGTVQARFPARRTELLAGMVIGLLLLVGGPLAAWFAYHHQPPGPLKPEDQVAKYIFVALLATLLPLLGGGVLWLVTRAWHMEFLLGDKGVACAESGTYLGQVYLWADAVALQEVFSYETIRVFQLPFRRKTRKLQLVMRDGRTCDFEPSIVSQFRRFETLLRAAAAQHGIPWQTVEP